MAPPGSNNIEASSSILSDDLTIGKKPFNVTLTEQFLSWKYKKRHVFSDKEKKKWTCKNQVHVEEIVAVEYVQKESSLTPDGGDMEMVSLGASSFRVHIVKRVPKHLWKLKSVEIHCTSSTQCAEWVDHIQTLLEKYTNRPKSLLVFINPHGGKKRAKVVFDEKVAPLFDLAGITSHVIVTERADHAQQYIQCHDLNRYDGLVCVGGDGMFAELLNGLLFLHNKRAGVNVNDEHERLRQPHLRIGVIPAGSTDTVSYCTTGINDPVTSALHIIVGDSMAVDVCSVRNAYTSELIRFCVSMLGYGFYGDVLKDSEKLRAFGPQRYNMSGFKTFLRNRTYQATVQYLPSDLIQSDHHPDIHNGSRCYSGCTICKSASLLDLNGSLALDRSSISCTPVPEESESEEKFSAFERSLAGSMSNVSVMSRPNSCLSSVSPNSWQTVTGNFIGVNALTISCRCATVPEGVSPACHLGDGSTDLVLVHDASRLNYFRHLWRLKAKNSPSQFDFGFVNVIRAKAFKLRVTADDADVLTAPQSSSSFHRLDSGERLASHTSDMSCWNCDGEIIDEPNIDVRVHCQLVKIFARGIEDPTADNGQCSSTCLSCTGGI